MTRLSGQARELRAARLLYDIANVTRWIVGVVALTIPARLALADRVPLTLGGDVNDPDAQTPTVQIGVVVEPDMSQTALIAHNLVAMIVAAIVVLALTELMGILRNVLSGNAFVQENGARLRRIGWIGAIGQLSIYAVWVGSATLAAAMGWELRNLSIELSPLPWIGVLSAFALATVFNDAAVMKSEQELTV